MANNILYELRHFPNGMHFISRCVIYGSSKCYKRGPLLLSASNVMNEAESSSSEQYYRLVFDNDDIKRSTIIASGFTFKELKLKLPFLFI